MGAYHLTTLDGLYTQVTSFRSEEGYVTFYRESDYVPGRLRSEMTPVGTYLFMQGFTIQEQVSELPAHQSFNSSYENIVEAAVVRSTLQLNALYTQEGTDLNWALPGHPKLLAFIDFVDPMLPSGKKAGDVLNANYDLVQTIVMRHLRCISRTITAQDGGGVQFALSFNGGEVVRLANNTMDL